MSVFQGVAIGRSPRVYGNRRKPVQSVIWVAAALAAFLCRCIVFASEGERDLLLVIPHAHWEGAVYKTEEEYLEIGLPHILKALNLLKKYPNYRFVLDQACYVKPFLERYPSEVPVVRKFVAEGRLQIVGGTHTMHDTNMPSGESIVRQYLLSKSYFRDKLGVDVKTGWALDAFGHNAQMPQILKLAGLKSYWFERGPANPASPSEFLWKGIDGTRIPAFWLATSYVAFYNSPRIPGEFENFSRGRFEALTPHTRARERAVLAGADVSEPEEHLPQMVDEFSRRGTSPFSLRLALPSDFEALVEKRATLPTIEGEMNPLFQGVYSSRIEVKQANRNLERILTTAEKLDAVANWLGADSQRLVLEKAWEPVLFNQAHDLASGVMVDKVYEDTLRKFVRAEDRGQEIFNSGFDAIASRVDTSGEGIPLVVFNSLGWARTDVAEVTVGISEPGVEALTLRDSAGAAVHLQPLEVKRNADGGIRHMRFAFIARDVPSMGYTIYRVFPKSRSPESRPKQGTGSSRPRWTTNLEQDSIENDFFQATFNLLTGEMTSLILKEDRWEVLAGAGNVIAREKDGGDFWQLYGTLNGGGVTMKRPIVPPDPRRTEYSNETVGNGSIRMGPVFSEFSLAHPFGKGHIATRVRMYAGVRRIDFRTEILNNDEYVRYRALFPLSLKSGRSTHEIAFGAIERPQSQEFPAQNWVDYGDEKRGIALLNRGLPGNNVSNATLMLSLMQSSSIITEPGEMSGSGLELGKRLAFDYALVPHVGSWRDAAIYRSGLEFNHPLLVRACGNHAGDLPGRHSFLSLSSSNIVLSALKLGKDGRTFVRVYEATGRAVKSVKMRVPKGVQTVHEANLIEDSGEPVVVRDGAFELDLGAFQIKTFGLRFARSNQVVTEMAREP